MIPELVAQLYAAGAGDLAADAVACLALIFLAAVAVYALRGRASAEASARYEKARAAEIENRERTRVNNLAEILDISNRINANLELEPLLNEVARAVSGSLGFKMALVRILDEDNKCFVARAFAGLDDDAVAKLSARTVPVTTFETWMRDEFRISRSYFISHEYGFWSDHEDEVYVPDLGERKNGEWHPMDSLFVPLWTRDQQLVGYLSVDDPVDRRIPTMETIETLEIFANQAVTAIENARLYGRLEDHVVQLRAMTRRLKELNEIKSNFVATVSHELRTPLTSIRAYAETLARDLGSSPRETEIEFLKIIEEEAERLSTIVEEMLDLSRMESGKLEMKKTETDIQKIAWDVFHVLSPAAHKKYIILEAPAEKEPVVGYVDEGMIKQLLVNLIGNAVKFTPEGGKVSIGVRDLDSTVELCVEDTGIGIPPSSVKRIFEEFYQVDSSATRQYGGVGLGLAIVKSIVEWHDGKIWVESVDKKGTKFTVSIPKRKAVAREVDETAPADDGWQCEKRIPELVVDMIAELIGVKTASLMLVNGETDELYVSAAMGLDQAIMRDARVKMGEGISGWVAKTGNPVLIHDIDMDERFERQDRPQYETRSVISVPLKDGDNVIGVINVTNKIDLMPFSDNDAEILQILADRVTAVLDKVRDFEGIKSEFTSIANSLECLIEARRSPHTRKGEELTALVVELSHSMGLKDEEVRLLQYVSRIYDVGMVRVSESILRKPGGLGRSEYESVKKHPEAGVDIVGPIEFLDQVKEVILHHHERYDGQGYPGGLSGESIPIGARILAVVDAYGSMTSERPYRDAMSQDEALEELKRCSGSQFDPKVVENLTKVLKERREGVLSVLD